MKLSYIIIAFLCTPCLAQSAFAADVQAADNLTIDSIVILPVEARITPTTSKVKTAQLNDGVAALTSIFSDYFADKPQVTLLSKAQEEAEAADFKGGRLKLVRHLGEKLKVDAVLISSVDRFEERQGDKYSIDVPASVSLSFKLMHIKTGRIICNGTFSETQKSLVEDLFSFPKAFGRGFKWISARELAQEGVENKFSQCQYLP